MPAYMHATQGLIPKDYQFVTEAEVRMAERDKGSEAALGRPATGRAPDRFSFALTGFTSALAEVDLYHDPDFVSEIEPILREIERRYGVTRRPGSEVHMLVLYTNADGDLAVSTVAGS